MRLDRPRLLALLAGAALLAAVLAVFGWLIVQTVAIDARARSFVERARAGDAPALVALLVPARRAGAAAEAAGWATSLQAVRGVDRRKAALDTGGLRRGHWDARLEYADGGTAPLHLELRRTEDGWLIEGVTVGPRAPP